MSKSRKIIFAFLMVLLVWFNIFIIFNGYLDMLVLDELNIINKIKDFYEYLKAVNFWILS